MQDSNGQYVSKGAAGLTLKYNATYLCIWSDILNGTLAEEYVQTRYESCCYRD